MSREATAAADVLINPTRPSWSQICTWIRQRRPDMSDGTTTSPPRTRRRAAGSLSIAVLAVVALAACGGAATDDKGAAAPRASEPAAAEGQAAGDPGLQHIHGLGVSAGRLLIATHSGLFTAAEGETQARRFGSTRQDVMGFSVIDGKRIIGSGHPAPGQGGSPNLGLIESRDGARTWKTLSLDGDADFHALVSSGRRVYGYDGTQGRLMVSSDGGRSWQERRPPSGIFSIAIDPQDPDRIVTATEEGLLASSDVGKTLRPLSAGEPLVGLLAWAAPDRLYLIDGQGQVLRSTDRGRRWSPVGAIAGQPAAFIADGKDLYAALTDGTVKRSSDGGATWTVRAAP